MGPIRTARDGPSTSRSHIISSAPPAEKLFHTSVNGLQLLKFACLHSLIANSRTGLSQKTTARRCDAPLMPNQGRGGCLVPNEWERKDAELLTEAHFLPPEASGPVCYGRSSQLVDYPHELESHARVWSRSGTRQAAKGCFV